MACQAPTPRGVSSSNSVIHIGGDGSVLRIDPEVDLPPEWSVATSRTTGEIYYVNASTGESQFERPELVSPAPPPLVSESELESRPEPGPGRHARVKSGCCGSRVVTRGQATHSRVISPPPPLCAANGHRAANGASHGTSAAATPAVYTPAKHSGGMPVAAIEAKPLCQDNNETAATAVVMDEQRVALQGMKLSMLKRRAEATPGLSDDALEAAMDADHPRDALVELILSFVTAAAAEAIAAAALGPTVPEPEVDRGQELTSACRPQPEQEDEPASPEVCLWGHFLAWTRVPCLVVACTAAQSLSDSCRNPRSRRLRAGMVAARACPRPLAIMGRRRRRRRRRRRGCHHCVRRWQPHRQR
jgi:hypothetical protein